MARRFRGDRDSNRCSYVSNDGTDIVAYASCPRLKGELEMFDLGFFEEVEDLKYSYSRLKREARKLGEKGVRRHQVEYVLINTPCA